MASNGESDKILNNFSAHHHHRTQYPPTMHPPQLPSPESGRYVIMKPPKSYPSPPLSDIESIVSDAGSDKGNDHDVPQEEAEVKHEVVEINDESTSENPGGPYFNIKPNKKPKACNNQIPISPFAELHKAEGRALKNSDRTNEINITVPVDDAKYAKDLAYFLFHDAHSKGYVHSVIFLVGAEGPAHPVGVMKYMISHFSPIIREQLKGPEACDCVIVPNYTVQIIALLVELLHTGQVTACNKDHMTLMWDLMKDLGISYNMNSFFYYEIEEDALGMNPIKSEPPEILESKESSVLMLPPEVNRVNSTWMEEEIPNDFIRKQLRQTTSFYGSYQSNYTYHPENPTEVVRVHNLVNNPKRIRMLHPAFALIHADQIEAEKKEEEKMIIEKVLAEQGQNEIIVVDGDDKSTRSASPSLLRDESFKSLVMNDVIPLESVKEAVKSKSKIIRLPTRHSRQSDPCVIDIESSTVASTFSQSETPPPDNNTYIQQEDPESHQTFIPPNFDNRTGIAVISQPTCGPPRKKTVLPPCQTPMPHLEPAMNRETQQQSPVKNPPRLDMYETTNETIGLLSPAANPSPHPVAAVVVPKSKVDIAGSTSRLIVNREKKVRFVDDGEQPCSSTSLLMPRMKDDSNKRTYLPQHAIAKKKIKLSVEETAPGGIQEMYNDNLLRQMQQHFEPQTIVVASRKKEVPGGVKVDTYIEDHDPQNFPVRQADNWNAERSPQVAAVVERMAVETGNSRESIVFGNGDGRGRGRGRPRGSRGRGRGRGRPTEPDARLRSGCNKTHGDDGGNDENGNNPT